LPPVWGMGKVKNEFSLGRPQGGWVGLRAIGWVSVGVWVVQVVHRCSGVQNWKMGKWPPDGPKMGGSKIASPKIGPLRGHLPMGPKWGVQVAPPQVGPCGVSCPFVWFWPPEGQWGWGMGPEVPPRLWMGNGCNGCAKRGIGNGSTASLRLGMGYGCSVWLRFG